MEKVLMILLMTFTSPASGDVVTGSQRIVNAETCKEIHNFILDVNKTFEYEKMKISMNMICLRVDGNSTFRMGKDPK